MLDEPTNDLDLETLDLLQETIADFDGTVLIVSHDRDFLDRTVTMVLGLDGSGRVDVVVGGYSDYEAKRRAAPTPSAKPRSAPLSRKYRSRRTTARAGSSPTRTSAIWSCCPPRSRR
ncbi:hypothetical protein [Hankyongella ginsenosidimutans]|uniref:hypothetical protein n=1 Tax=Hankyongella ginsenosidimutans TaxID=1763828 RepID=UPI003CCC8AFD